MNILTTAQSLEPTIANLKGSNFVQPSDIQSATDEAHTYEYTFDTSLKHSNATQNIYFSNYIEWQGNVRERWFYDCIDQTMLQTEGVFVTKEVHQFYVKEGMPFDTIVCHLNTFGIQRCGFRLLFRFYSQGQLISYGYQHVVFTNHRKRITRLPQHVVEKIEAFYVPAEQNTF